VSDAQNQRPEPAPEGVNLLGDPATEDHRLEEKARRRNALGPFGMAWLWAVGSLLLATSLYKLVAGPLLAAGLPTTKGTVLRWILVPGSNSTSYVPKVSYKVAGTSYEFIAGTSVSTMTDAPKTILVSYVPFDPATAMWQSGLWWGAFFDTYEMVVLILGIILFCTAVYQWRIRRYWKGPGRLAAYSNYRLHVIAGIIGIVGGGAWLISGYVPAASWFIPPAPNAIAITIIAFGVALLVSGIVNRHLPAQLEAEREKLRLDLQRVRRDQQPRKGE